MTDSSKRALAKATKIEAELNRTPIYSAEWWRLSWLLEDVWGL